MSVKALTWAWGLFEILDLPPDQRLVLISICWWHKDKTNECTPSQKVLAEMSGYRRQRVSQIIGRLEATGLIKREKERLTTGKFDSCNYRLFGSFKGYAMSDRGGQGKQWPPCPKKRDTATVSARGGHYKGDTIKGDDGNVFEFPEQPQRKRSGGGA